MTAPSCPKCGFKPPADQAAETCPACGIVYHKYWARQRGQSPQHNPFSSPPEPSVFWQGLKEQLLTVPQQVDPVVFWGRMVTLLGITLWTFYFVAGGVSWERIGGSFLHNVNLPFHEFGHVLFSPFGDFLMILGGSLFQVVMPLGWMIAFSLVRSDNFGAAVMLWWSGQNFVDVAPYIADAQDRLLPLVGGRGDESHDWGNLLTMTDSLAHTSQIAHTSFVMGTVLMLLGLTWASYIAYLQKRNLVELAG